MSAVYRCFAEKKSGFDVEAQGLFRELKGKIPALQWVRLFHRYDVEGITENLYAAARETVFSEPQVDALYDEELPRIEGQHSVLAVEALPGQYDQRADSCCQCIQLLSGGDRPLVSAATVYILGGTLTEADVSAAAGLIINPVDARRASAEKPQTLRQNYPEPKPVAVLDGFCQLAEKGLFTLIEEYGLAMDLDDLKCLQTEFREDLHRNPTLTELRLVDTYWSDHCRHTTFSTHIDKVEILDPAVQKAYEEYLAARVEVYGAEKAAARPQTLMDLATISVKVLKKRGKLPKLDESEEINACSVHVTATVDGEEQDWLLMFKNETHNHPTEIEPFGGAATCIGGAIRDPLSGRAYVYQAMRVTGCGPVCGDLPETLAGKIPQPKLAQTAAAGYSSYGNQIGLATGLVSEVYHPGYVAKHLEVGAVVGAAPAKNVVRICPAPGDVVILMGGRTGRDGIGGATGSSKTHNLQSLDRCAAEVQKGNAPEERKLQRLFRDPSVAQKIKRCNDFGAGGVSVAIGELADGLTISLDAVRKKYDGLDGTELAISESQERMAVVVSPENADYMIAAAEKENLEAYIVAVVTAEPRLTLTWEGAVIADLPRKFLDSNGAAKHTAVAVPAPNMAEKSPNKLSLKERFEALTGDASFACQRGLTQRFDSTIGGSSVLVPYGGKYQRTPTQSMAALLPVGPGKKTDTCSVMAWGFDPISMSENPFRGAALSVVDSVCKLVAAGCDPAAAYLSFQEYFERLRDEPARWGKPFSALLGAFSAQLGLGLAAIGGKDSMSGSFLDLDVPPTLISFAIAPEQAGNVRSPEFKGAGHPVYLFATQNDDYENLKTVWGGFHDLSAAGKVCAAWAVGRGGIAEGLLKMAEGNGVGFTLDGSFPADDLFAPGYGSLLAECSEEVSGGRLVGYTAEGGLTFGEVKLPTDYGTRFETATAGVYPTAPEETAELPVATISCDRRAPMVCKNKVAMPRAVIPVFPGTNCEYDTANALLKAGIQPEILVVQNLTGDLLRQSAEAFETAISRSQMIVLPGGFSGGDEPEGSAKFICAFLRNPAITDAVHDLLKNRDGLMLGICNGFQALIKLGLVPYGEIVPVTADCATLTFNNIARHQSRYVTTRISSVQSPWMAKSAVGDLHAIPVSHGEGRFVAPPQLLEKLIANGQIATQYVGLDGVPSMDIEVNPNGAVACVEGLFSPDGRVFGKMGHSERAGDFIAKNIPGNKYQPIFESGAYYFK
ncbi:MAG: phosphoribosylformylglycinamidine synthase [Oscillospiraceae bacterium]